MARLPIKCYLYSEKNKKTVIVLKTEKSRIDAVDALRGFAVMAILLVHSLEHFIFPVYPASSPAWLAALDEGVFAVVFALFAGKAYAIFALLFGFTFHLQYASRQSRGEDFGGRFLWRLLLLVGFATLNAAFFPAGDVLLLFSLVGVVLFAVRRLNDRTVLALALLFLVQPVEWYHCFRALADPGFAPPDLGVGAMYGEVAAYTKAGDFWQFVAGNVTLGQKASLLWAVNAGRYSQTAGLFLLGLLLGRRGLFSDSADNARFWVRTLIVGAVAFVPLQALHGLFGEATAARMAATVLDMWQKLAFTAVLAASFVLLYRTARFRRVTDGLRFYGRMSLTNYIAQSVVGALIFFPFGLGLASRCGYALSLVIGVAVFVLQAAFCRWWLRGHRQGPLESLWHRLTWLGAK